MRRARCPSSSSACKGNTQNTSALQICCRQDRTGSYEGGTAVPEIPHSLGCCQLDCCPWQMMWIRSQLSLAAVASSLLVDLKGAFFVGSKNFASTVPSKSHQASRHRSPERLAQGITVATKLQVRQIARIMAHIYCLYSTMLS